MPVDMPLPHPSESCIKKTKKPDPGVTTPGSALGVPPSGSLHERINELRSGMSTISQREQIRKGT